MGRGNGESGGVRTLCRAEFQLFQGVCSICKNQEYREGKNELSKGGSREVRGKREEGRGRLWEREVTCLLLYKSCMREHSYCNACRTISLK